ncbi:MAG: rod shape determining protein RodA [Chitinophagales bacterium]|jgi:rod shape determining protein RodA
MRSDGFINSIDWVLIGLYLLLATLGLAFVYSTTYIASDPSFFNFTTSYGRQFIWLCISLIVGMFIVVIDYKFYTSFAYIIFGLIMLLLASVLIFGVEINGSKSWFALGSFRFQPAELAKFATCLALAKVMTGVNVNLKTWTGKFKALTVLLIPIGLILMQGDVGSAIVFAGLIFVLHREGLESAYLIVGFGSIFLSVMALLYHPLALLFFYGLLFSLVIYYNRKAKQPIIALLLILIGGLTYAYLYKNYILQFFPWEVFGIDIQQYLFLFIPVIILILVGYFIFLKRKKWLPASMVIFLIVGMYTFSVDFMFNNVLKQHHRDRINLILGKIEDHSGAGYNLFQSKVAIGSGGMFGKGYLQGTQTLLNYVPEQSTDFIFTSVAEQFGFVGSFFIILLYVVLLLRIIQVAERQRSTLARVYGYGVASILFVHFAVNVGMTIGLVPVIGIPLPFFSYGGSSLLSFTILLFVLIKFDTERLSVLR